MGKNKFIQLDINRNELILDPGEENLESSSVFQLKFFGFRKEANVYKSCAPIRDLLPKVVSYFKKSNLTVRLSKQCEYVLQTLKNDQDKFNRLKTYLREYKDGKIKNDKSYCEHVDSLKSMNKNRALKDHQIKASFHLYTAKNGANFSAPGSGKTAVVLTVYQRLKNEGNVDALFIIGPPSCFGSWKDEFRTVLGREPMPKIFAGGNIASRKEAYRKNEYSELNLSTFQTVANDYKDIPKLFETARIFLVVDEAHYIKRIDGGWANAVLSVGPHAKYRAVLTGTPMPQSYTDFYNLFDFLFPNTPVLNRTQKSKLKNYTADSDIESATQLLKQMIEPLFYRVRKAELGLDKQEFDTVLIKMNPREREVYDAIQTRIIQYSRDDYLKNIDYVDRLAIGRMMRLRQCASYIKLLLKTIKNYDENLLDDEENLEKIVLHYDEYEKPAKLVKLIEMVKEFIKDDQKILIWSNFIGTIKLIESELKKNNLSCKKIIGDTPTETTDIREEETREDIRKEFIDKNSSLKILIANPAACAESISLHKSCNHAIYYDLSYNCAQYLQSLDRIHRVGGSEERPSFYYFLQYENTIDINILDSLKKKAEKMAKIIDKDYPIYSLDMFDTNDEVSAYHELIKQ